MNYLCCCCMNVSMHKFIVVIKLKSILGFQIAKMNSNYANKDYPKVWNLGPSLAKTGPPAFL